MYEQTIAVVGMGLRYPSAETKEALCSMLEQGISAPVGDHQARGDLLGIPDYHRFLQSIRCIDHLDWFDNSYFGYERISFYAGTGSQICGRAFRLRCF